MHNLSYNLVTLAEWKRVIDWCTKRNCKKTQFIAGKDLANFSQYSVDVFKVEIPLKRPEAQGWIISTENFHEKIIFCVVSTSLCYVFWYYGSESFAAKFMNALKYET